MDLAPRLEQVVRCVEDSTSRRHHQHPGRGLGHPVEHLIDDPTGIGIRRGVLGDYSIHVDCRVRFSGNAVSGYSCICTKGEKDHVRLSRFPDLFDSETLKMKINSPRRGRLKLSCLFRDQWVYRDLSSSVK